MLLSLLPVGILFVRKVSANKVLNVLNLLCLFFFFQQLINVLVQPGTPFVQTGLQLAAFTIVFYLIKLMITSSRLQQLLNMLLVSLLSITITVYATKGSAAFTEIIYVVQAAIVALLAFVVILQLINNRQIVLANDPAFWIAGGLLCYAGMSIFIEALTGFSAPVSQEIQLEKDLVLSAAAVLRLILFCVAAKLGRDA